MKFYVGITDQDWINHLQTHKAIEANFWRPSAQEKNFNAIRQGDVFLFKQHKSDGDCIVGGGLLQAYTRMSISEAWLTFGLNNGTETREELFERAKHYRAKRKLSTYYADAIDCIVLTKLFFMSEADHILKPSDWANAIVSGKTYDWNSEFGAEIKSTVFKYLEAANPAQESSIIREQKNPYGNSYLTRGRLGQGVLRLQTLENFNNRCCISGETLTEVLECAHLKALSQNGSHDIDNTVPLRSDLHQLYDLGLISFDDTHNVILSDLIPMDSVYRAFEGKSMANSKNPIDPESIRWHRETVFRLNSSE